MMPSTTLNGYTCGYCGAFVPNGTYHACTGASIQQPQIHINYLPYIPVLERIASALERIAMELEKRK